VATVPEAAVDEDRELLATKHDVRSHAKAFDSDDVVLSEAKPPTVQCGSEDYLSLRVGPPVRLADLGRRFATRLGIRDTQPSAEIEDAAR
jgi:hypothetical protein